MNHNGNKALHSFILRTLCACTLMVSGLALAEEDKAPEKTAPTKDDYKLDVSGSSKRLKINEDGLFSLSITPVAGLKVHPDAPLEVKLKTSQGLTTTKKKLGRKDAVEPTALAPTLQTAIRGESTGKKEIQADISFFLCSKTWCQRMTDKLVVDVTIAK